MTRKDTLGSAEGAVLAALLGRRGHAWAADDRPLWESRHWTLTLLNTLTSKGLVDELDPNKRYELTAEGRAKAAEIGAVSRSLEPEPYDPTVDWPRQRNNATIRSSRFPRN
jgi:hypothetical protein